MPTSATLETRQLQVFVTLARTLNMRRAAAELGLTTSGVSHGLKALERNLGCQLLQRGLQRLTLSPAGELFLAEARGILGHMESARRRLKDWSAQPPDRLQIRASAAVCRRIIAPALREIREGFPSLTISLAPPPTDRTGTGAEPSASAEAHRAWPGLTWSPDPPPTPQFERLSLGQDELRCYAHPLHPWVVRRRIDRNDFTRHRLILPEASTSGAVGLRDYFHTEGLEPRPFLEVTDDQVALDLIRLDLGAGVLPRWVAADAVRDGAVVELPLGRRRLKREWFVFYPRGHDLSLPERLLLNLTQKRFQEISTADDAPIASGPPETNLNSPPSPTESDTTTAPEGGSDAAEPVAF